MGTLRLEQMEEWRRRKAKEEEEEEEKKPLSRWTKRKGRTNGKEAPAMFSVNWEIESIFLPLYFICFSRFSLFPALIHTQNHQSTDSRIWNAIDWSSNRWECVTGSASHHKTNDPGPFARTHTHTRRNRECVYVTMNSEHECIYILPLLCLSTTSLLFFSLFFSFFFVFSLSYTLSCRNLMHRQTHTRTHTHLPAIENRQWSECASFSCEKTVG